MSPGKLAGLFALALAALGAVAYGWRTSHESHAVFEPVIPKIESRTPCPWRDAETDMTNWFPGATKYLVQDLILSGKRLQLQERLGRPVLSDEMALHCYPVLSNDVSLGTVLTRRTKGEHGAIEVALALGSSHSVRRFKIQRLREPAQIVEALAKCELEKQIENKSAGEEIVFDCPDAKVVSDMLAKEVKALLILYDMGYRELPKSHH
jgi:hypothetical protein